MTVVMADRFGRVAGPDAASFRCAGCGEIAAVVRVVPAGAAADMGPPLGRQSQSRAGVVVDYFDGTAWKAVGIEVFQAVRGILASEAPNPVALRQIDWELAPFHCPECGQNYCRADWHPTVVFDEGFYDCTRGRCPNGHEHMIDD